MIMVLMTSTCCARKNRLELDFLQMILLLNYQKFQEQFILDIILIVCKLTSMMCLSNIDSAFIFNINACKLYENHIHIEIKRIKL